MFWGREKVNVDFIKLTEELIVLSSSIIINADSYDSFKKYVII